MNDEIFEKALSIIKGYRVRAIEENERRVFEINSKIPQIREINAEIFNSGKELVNLIGNGSSSEIAQRIQQLKNYNLGAQEMSRNILVASGYPADYLDIHYNCPKCRDTGYLNSEYCECLRKLCGKLFAEELNKSAQLKLSSFDTFDLRYYSGSDYDTMKRIFDFAKEYAGKFPEDTRSIYITGGTGLGKTHISLAIANKVLENGHSVIYDSTINILRHIEKEHFSSSHSTDYIDTIMDTDLLILDDLGTEFETKFYNSAIYNIINTRLNSCKPTIISTNLNMGEIKQRYDERIVSRIVAAYVCLEFSGEDVRFQKRRKEELEKEKQGLLR